MWVKMKLLNLITLKSRPRRFASSRTKSIFWRKDSSVIFLTLSSETFPGFPASGMMLTLSAYLAAIRNKPLPPPPTMTGGCGFWMGLGRVAELIELAAYGGPLVCPQRENALERLIQHPQPLRDRRKRDPRHLKFGFRPSGTQTRKQSPVADVVERYQTLRGNGGMAEQIAQHQ